jgi:hypothetical protein
MLAYRRRKSLGSTDVFCRMTALAIQPSMFTVERIPGLGVIETSDGWCPTNEREIFSVVCGVVLHATLAAVGLTEIGSVQTAIGSQPRGYFFMTLETLECGFTRGDGVASVVHCVVPFRL